MNVFGRFFIAITAILMILIMSACTIVPIDPDEQPGAVGSAVLRARNVDEYLEDYWDTYIVPEIQDRKVTLGSLIASVNSVGWDQTGQAYGEIRGDIGASYTFIVYDNAVVIETNTESRNGFVIVEIDGVYDYEVRVSIGPALSGTAIRDSLRFVDFNQFVNQVDFARLATELNNRGNERAAQNFDLFELDGETIDFTGAFVAPSGSNVITIMPIFLEVK